MEQKGGGSFFKQKHASTDVLSSILRAILILNRQISGIYSVECQVSLAFGSVADLLAGLVTEAKNCP